MRCRVITALTKASMSCLSDVFYITELMILPAVFSSVTIGLKNTFRSGGHEHV